jgi:hypothetical protein
LIVVYFVALAMLPSLCPLPLLRRADHRHQRCTNHRHYRCCSVVPSIAIAVIAVASQSHLPLLSPSLLLHRCCTFHHRCHCIVVMPSIATVASWLLPSLPLHRHRACVTTREKSDSEVKVELRRIKEEVDFVGKL